MNDWLSKIEREQQLSRMSKALENIGTPIQTETRGERMARVIRELAQVAVQANPHRYSYNAADLHDALSALSDDAKELLE